VAHVFSEEERDTLLTIAGQIALALNNADLYQQAVSANRLKSEFLANISHELRTPLNAIIGYSDMLIQGIYGDLSPQQQDRLSRVHNSGKHLLSMIDNVLGLARIEAGRVHLNIVSIALEEVLQAVVANAEPLAREKGLAIDLEIKPGFQSMRVLADTTALPQILTNLIDNGIKFTHEGGLQIGLACLSMYRGRPLYGSGPPNDIHIPDGDWAVISIRDTGIGIKPEHHRIIFDEFRQADGSTVREYGGGGLGLALSRRLLDLMSGYIWLESEVDVGSVFTVLLPIDIGSTEGTGDTAYGQDAPLALALGRRHDTLVSINTALATASVAMLGTIYAAHFMALARRGQRSAFVIDVNAPLNALGQLLLMLKSDPSTNAVPILLTNTDDRQDTGVYLRLFDILTHNGNPDRLTAILARLGGPHAHDPVMLVGGGAQNYATHLQRSGVPTVTVDNSSGLDEQLRTQLASMILFDFNANVAVGFTFLQYARTKPLLATIPVIGILPTDAAQAGDWLNDLRTWMLRAPDVSLAEQVTHAIATQQMRRH
jgi:signal transduction histidine kinase